MGIVSGLLLGWFLGLFGFKGVAIAGMAQLFGVKLTVLGYYFIFAILGAIHSIISRFRKPSQVELDNMEKFNKIWSKNYKK